MDAGPTRLLCFPYAGGSAAVFHGWSARLSTHIRVDAFELPGRQGRFAERPVADIRRLVTQVIEERRPWRPPFALFGHSMGALVAFEVARELRRRGLPAPAHVFVSARPAPRYTPWGTPLSRLPDALLIREIHRQFGPAHGLPKSRELLDLLLPTLRADLALVETYHYDPEPPLDCRITAFAGDRDTIAVDGVRGWREETRAGFRLVRFAGDHFFLTSRRDQVLAAIQRQLLGEPTLERSEAV